MRGLASKGGPKITIDLNIVVTSVFGAVVLWMFTSWGSSNKERYENQKEEVAKLVEKQSATKSSVDKIEMTLPIIQKTVDGVQAELKEAKQDLTKTRDVVQEVKIEQVRVRDKFEREDGAMYSSPKPKEKL